VEAIVQLFPGISQVSATVRLYHDDHSIGWYVTVGQGDDVDDIRPCAEHIVPRAEWNDLADALADAMALAAITLRDLAEPFPEEAAVALSCAAEQLVQRSRRR
jgi:hypothetical protein